MIKVVVLAAFVAVATAGVLAPAAYRAPILGAPIFKTANIAPASIVAPIAKAVADADYDPNPQYSYAYDIQDSVTGDFKNHFESRNGDAVQGRYSLVEPDGTRRIVEYIADPVNGFNAVVHKEPFAPIAKIAAPALHSKIIY